jgi:hypothetical protein
MTGERHIYYESVGNLFLNINLKYPLTTMFLVFYLISDKRKKEKVKRNDSRLIFII